MRFKKGEIDLFVLSNVLVSYGVEPFVNKFIKYSGVINTTALIGTIIAVMLVTYTLINGLDIYGTLILVGVKILCYGVVMYSMDRLSKGNNDVIGWYIIFTLFITINSVVMLVLCKEFFEDVERW